MARLHDVDDADRALAERRWFAAKMAVGAPLVASVVLTPAFHYAGPVIGSAAIGLAHASVGEPDRGLLFAMSAPVVVALGLSLGYAWDESRPRFGDDAGVGIGEGRIFGMLGAFTLCTVVGAIDAGQRADGQPQPVFLPGIVPVSTPGPVQPPERRH